MYQMRKKKRWEGGGGEKYRISARRTRFSILARDNINGEKKALSFSLAIYGFLCSPTACSTRESGGVCVCERERKREGERQRWLYSRIISNVANCGSVIVCTKYDSVHEIRVDLGAERHDSNCRLNRERLNSPDTHEHLRFRRLARVQYRTTTMEIQLNYSFWPSDPKACKMYSGGKISCLKFSTVNSFVKEMRARREKWTKKCRQIRQSSLRVVVRIHAMKRAKITLRVDPFMANTFSCPLDVRSRIGRYKRQTLFLHVLKFIRENFTSRKYDCIFISSMSSLFSLKYWYWWKWK